MSNLGFFCPNSCAISTTTQRTAIQLNPSPARPNGYVVAEELALLFKRARVQTVVLNACQSASSTSTWANNFAANVVCNHCGVQNAVAISFKISADGARIFMQTVYHNLFKETWCCTPSSQLDQRCIKKINAMHDLAVKLD